MPIIDQIRRQLLSSLSLVFGQDDSVSPSPPANPVIPPSLTTYSSELSSLASRPSASVSEGWGMDGWGDSVRLEQRLVYPNSLDENLQH